MLWLLGCVVLALSAVPPTHAQQARDTAIQLWACNATSPNQRFLINNTQIASLTATAPQLVWDITGPSNVSGSKIHLFSIYPTKSQQWVYNNKTGAISSVFAPGMCVSSGSPTAAVGTQLEIAPCNGPSILLFSYDPATSTLALRQESQLCADAGTIANCSTYPYSSYLYCDSSATPDARAADLVPRLTGIELGTLLSNGNNGVPRLGVSRIGYGKSHLCASCS
jgi:hypothetical protein